MKQGVHIEEVLASQGFYISTTSGTSMSPMLRDRRDTIIIRPVSERLKKYDVPLYKRGNEYVLHRIVKVTPTGYVICGDNCLKREYQVTDREIIGVLRGFYRGDRVVDMNGLGYWMYCRLWVMVYPVRYELKKVKIIVKRGRKCISR